MSYVAFKRDVLEAFDGEPVVVEISRREQRFGVQLRTGEGYSVFAHATDRECPDRASRRLFAITLYKDFVEGVAEHKQAAAADALREQFGTPQ